MLALTSPALLVVCALLSLAVPAALVLTWRRRPRGVAGGSLRFVVVLVSQALAITTAGLVANNTYGFYNSWTDLVGGRSAAAPGATPNTLVPRDGSQGRVVTLSVAQSGPVAAGASRTLTVLAWLPPQYDQAQYRGTRFPVTMMLPGQPGTPQGVMRQFDFARQATAAINQHLVAPFVAVIPPLMVAPPRDTECTDVPRGPQAETWLSTDVRNAAIAHLRVAKDPQAWSAMGWSTGGFCAAKLLLNRPALFHAAVGIGGYYAAETDKTTGSLFGRSAQVRDANSPLWLVTQHLRRLTHLLIVVSKQDKSSYSGKFYADSRSMIAATAGVPGVATIVLPAGGHNYRVYQPTLVQSLAWLGRTTGL
jgi:S-formylglutathione hydrolase FrmB